jgi:hypothetical protein
LDEAGSGTDPGTQREHPSVIGRQNRERKRGRDFDIPRVCDRSTSQVREKKKHRERASWRRPLAVRGLWTPDPRMGGRRLPLPAHLDDVTRRQQPPRRQPRRSFLVLLAAAPLLLRLLLPPPAIPHHHPPCITPRAPRPRVSVCPPAALLSEVCNSHLRPGSRPRPCSGGRRQAGGPLVAQWWYDGCRQRSMPQ